MSAGAAAWVDVDLAAIAANIRTVKGRLAQGVSFMAVVKANAYGHGMLRVAGTALAAGADRLGVARAEEALELRRAGIRAPVQILGEVLGADHGNVIAAEIDVTTGRADAIEALAAAGRTAGKHARVHLKVDTGMGRIGCSPAEALPLARRVMDDPDLTLAGVMTHYATSEKPSEPSFVSQLAVWRDVRATLVASGIAPDTWHCANSAATILTPETHDDMVRCGISIYGLHPGESTRSVVELVPALSLTALVTHVKRVEAGTAISYGHTWRAPAPTTIATVAIGYGDGFTRLLSGKAEAVIGGRRVPVVGRITMDQCMLAVPDDVTVRVGDAASLIGPDLPADELAEVLGTINYEIVCMLDDRLPRRYGDATEAIGDPPGGASS